MSTFGRSTSASGWAAASTSSTSWRTTPRGRATCVSLKWQQTSGTAEQKVPYEAMCLIEAARCEPERYEKAYLVLGGPAWTLRDFYTEGGLWEYMRHEELLSIIDAGGVRGAGQPRRALVLGFDDIQQLQ